MVLNKQAIIDANDLTQETVTVKEWGGDVIIIEMSGSERDAYEQSIFEIKGNDRKINYENMRAKLVARCLVDDNKVRLFSDKEIGELGKKSSKVLDKLYEVAAKLNGIGPKEEEELTKNSD